MSDVIAKELVDLLEQAEIWKDPNLEIVMAKVEEIAKDATMLEKVFLRSIKPGPEAQESIINFSFTVVSHGIFSLQKIIDGKEKEYLDPISLELIRDPVNLHATGQLYDRSTLEKHLKMKKTCPVTGKALDDARFTPVLKIKEFIDKFVTSSIEDALNYGTVALKLLQVMNVGVFRVGHFPFHINSFEQRKEFGDLLTPLEDVVERVLAYEEYNLELLRVQEECQFLQSKVDQLLDTRIRIAHLLDERGEVDESNFYLEKRILQNGLVDDVLKGQDENEFKKVKLNLMKKSFDYWVEKGSPDGILRSLRALAVFLCKVGEQTKVMPFLKVAEKALGREPPFLLFLGNFFENFSKRKKQAARVYFTLACKLEEKNRFSEEVIGMYEKSIKLYNRNPKAKNRYRIYLAKHKEYFKKPEEEENEEENEGGEEENEEAKSKKKEKVKKKEEPKSPTVSSPSEPEPQEYRRKTRVVQRSEPRMRRRPEHVQERDYSDLEEELNRMDSSAHRIQLLEDYLENDQDSEFLLKKIVDCFMSENRIDKVLEVTEEPEFETVRMRVRTEAMLERIQNTDKKVDKIKNVLVKVTNDFQRKLRILNVQYKDVRTQLQQQGQNINANQLMIQNTQSRSPPVQQENPQNVRTTIPTTTPANPQMRRSSPAIQQQQYKRATWQGGESGKVLVTFLNPGIQKSSGFQNVQIGDIRFRVQVVVADNTVVTLNIEMDFPEYLKEDEGKNYLLTVEFMKHKTEKKVNSRTTKILAISKTYFVHKQWLFYFSLEETK